MRNIVKIAIVSILFGSFLNANVIKEQMLLAYGSSVNNQAEQVHVYHILLRTEKEAKSMLTHLRNFHGEALKQEFIKLAKKYSTGPSASKGGDLGYFGRGVMVAPFEEKAFSMKLGSCERVKTQFGYHVLYLEDKISPKNDEVY